MMMYGDSYKLSIILNVINEWNTDRAFCNGVLLFCKDAKPDPDEWQIDHIDPKSKGGPNSNSNAQVLSREENREKWDK